MKRTRSLKRRKHFGNTGLNVLHLWNICIEASFLIFLVFGIHFFNHFVFLPFFLSPFNFFASIKLPSFRYTFVTHISFTLFLNGREHYILFLPAICYLFVCLFACLFLSFFPSFFFPFLLFIFIIYLFITATYCQLISVYYIKKDNK